MNVVTYFASPYSRQRHSTGILLSEAPATAGMEGCGWQEKFPRPYLTTMSQLSELLKVATKKPTLLASLQN